AVPATQPIVDHERPPFGHRGPTELQGEVSVETGMVCVSTYRRGFAAPPRYAAWTPSLLSNASPDPVNTMVPVSITYPRSAHCNALRAFCSTSKIVRFSRLNSMTIRK